MNRLLLFSLLLASTAGPAGDKPVRNLSEFGGKCDGVTDDTAAIQKAINVTSAAGGATIMFPKGVCLIATLPWGVQANIILLKSNVTLAGAGRNATEIRMKANTYFGEKGSSFQLFSTLDADTAAEMTTYNNIGFRDLTINVNGSKGNVYNPGSGTGPRVTIHLADANDITIERVDFIDTDVANSIWAGWGGMNRLRVQNNLRVQDCTFSNDGNNPLNTDNSQIVTMVDNSLITGNRFLATSPNFRMVATATELHGNNNVFSNNVVKGMKQALFIAAEIELNPLVKNATVRDNTIEDLGSNFVTLWADAFPPWASAKAYEAGLEVTSDTGRVYQCARAGTSAGKFDVQRGKLQHAGSTVTVTTAAPHNYTAGTQFVLSYAGEADPNYPAGTYAVLPTGLTPTQFKYAGASGTNQASTQAATVTGAGPAGTAANIPDGGARWSYVTPSAQAWKPGTAYPISAMVANSAGRLYRAVIGGTSAGAFGVNASGLSRAGGATVTVTTSAPHNYTPGTRFVLSYPGAADPNFPAGTYAVLASGITPRQFQYTDANAFNGPSSQPSAVAGAGPSGTAVDIADGSATWTYQAPAREIRGVTISNNTVKINPTRIGAGPGMIDAFIYGVSTAGPFGVGYINQVSIHHNNLVMSKPPAWVKNTAYAYGQLVRNTAGRIYRVHVAGKSTQMPTGEGTEPYQQTGEDGPLRWVFMPGYSISPAVGSNQFVDEWTIEDNTFEGFNLGASMTNAYTIPINITNVRIRRNKFVECATTAATGQAANDLIIYLDNTTGDVAPLSSSISNVFIEDNKFTNSVPQARPIYIANAPHARPMNYKITNNALNFRPTAKMVTLAGNAPPPAQVVLQGP